MALKITALIMLLGVGCTLLIGQSAPKPGTAPNVPAGRYQLFVSPHVRADTFMIDTETGKVWTHTQLSDIKDQPSVWLFDERIDSPDELRAWVARQPSK